LMESDKLLMALTSSKLITIFFKLSSLLGLCVSVLIKIITISSNKVAELNLINFSIFISPIDLDQESDQLPN